MTYGNIRKARFIERPNRFIARCLLDGEETVAHVRNTGRCRELLLPGVTVYLEENHKPQRRTRFTLIAVEKGDLLINMDSLIPNKVVQEALCSGAMMLPGIGAMRPVPEQRLGDSRFDFRLDGPGGAVLGYAEVKGVTLERDGVALFPDAPTERGVKHLRGLCDAKRYGYAVYVIFLIQFGGCRWFSPNDETHKAFGDALRAASRVGVEVLAYDCHVSPDSIAVAKPVEIRL